MVYQSVGRNQKPKGLKVKHALQVTLLLVLCIWLVYELKNSHYKLLGKNLKSSTSTTDMGRKGNAGSKENVEMDIHDGNMIIQHSDENGVKRDAGSNENVEMDIHDGNMIIQHSDENGVKRDAAVTEEVEEESLKHEDLHEKEFDPELKEDKELGKQPKKTLGNELIKGNAVDTEEAGLVPPETESSNITDPRGSLTGVNGFQDENGIPPDGHEAISVLSKETRNANLSMIMVDTSRVTNTVELVKQTNYQNNSEKPSGDFLGKLKSLGRNKASLNTTAYNSSQQQEVLKSENADKFRKLETDGSAEMTQEGNLVIEVSNSVHSQHEMEKVSTI